MATQFDMLLEHWSLQHEIGLGIKEVATAIPDLSLRTLGASALGREPMLGPKAILTNNLFHTLEPPQMMEVVIWEIE
jgi:hypothetical protein